MEHSMMRRRRFLLVTAASGSVGLTTFPSVALGQAGHDKTGIKARKKELLDSAYDCGVEFCTKYSSCSRGSVAALQKAVPFVPEDTGIIKAASCLSGGATPTKMANCGAFTGCGMVIGCMYGKGTPESAEAALDLMHKLHEQFDNEYGSVLCHGVRLAADANCADVVGKAARWTAEILIAVSYTHLRAHET